MTDNETGTVRLQSIKDFVHVARDRNTVEGARIAAVRSIRLALSKEAAPPIQDAIDADAVPLLLQLTKTDNEELSFEAGWCLVNIASGDSRFVEILIKHGMVKRFIEMVQEGSPRIQEQSMWGLGNVAGDCYNARNLVLREGLVPVLIDYLNTPGGLPVSALRNTVWTMSNLVRGKPKPELEAVLPLVALAARFAAHDDAEVATDALWTLCYLAEGDDERLSQVFEHMADSMPQILTALQHGRKQATPGVRVVGNLVSGSEAITQRVVDAGAVPQLLALLRHENFKIRKEACWALSNITAGSPDQIEAVLAAGALPLLLPLLEPAAPADVQREVAWVIANATNGRPDQIRRIVDSGALTALARIIPHRDDRMAQVFLEMVQNILKSGNDEDPNPYVQLMGETEVVDVLADMQKRESQEVYELAVHILETYFAAEEDEPDEAPEAIANNGNGNNNAANRNGEGLGVLMEGVNRIRFV